MGTFIYLYGLDFSLSEVEGKHTDGCRYTKSTAPLLFTNYGLFYYSKDLLPPRHIRSINPHRMMKLRMNPLKFKAVAWILFSSVAIAGMIKVNYAISHLYSFYDSATVETVRIDSVSLISADPAYGVIGIVGYGPLTTSGVNVRVDMTDAININSFNRGEAYSLKGRSYSVYYNPDFESARFHLMTLEEIRAKNFSTLIIGIALILPFVIILFFWFWNKKYLLRQ